MCMSGAQDGDIEHGVCGFGNLLTYYVYKLSDMQ